MEHSTTSTVYIPQILPGLSPSSFRDSFLGSSLVGLLHCLIRQSLHVDGLASTTYHTVPRMYSIALYVSQQFKVRTGPTFIYRTESIDKDQGLDHVLSSAKLPLFRLVSSNSVNCGERVLTPDNLQPPSNQRRRMFDSFHHRPPIGEFAT